MKLVLPALLALITTGGLLAPSALGHGNDRFPFFPMPPRFDSCGPTIRFGSPRFTFEIGGHHRHRPVHVHGYTYVNEREWIAPVYRDAVVAYDHCGRPITKRVLVRAGYWTVVRYRVCGCGERLRC